MHDDDIEFATTTEGKSHRSRLVGIITIVVLLVVGAAVVVLNTLPLSRLTITLPQSSPTVAQCQQRWKWVATDTAESFTAITALSTNDAWAVGTRKENSFKIAIIAHWDGKQWRDTPLLTDIADSWSINDIAASDALHVWAVGSNNNDQPLILRWNGSAWEKATTPATGADGNQLTSIAIASGQDIWAVGGSIFTPTTPTQTLHPFAEHWDGQSWHIVPVSASGTFSDIGVGASGDAWGIIGQSNQIVRWDGQAWKTMPSPAPTDHTLEIQAIAVDANDHVWAAGSYNPPTSNWEEPILEQWNGTTWTMMPTGDMTEGLEARGAFFDRLSVGSNSSLWLAGDFKDPNTRLERAFSLYFDGQASRLSHYPSFYSDPGGGSAFGVLDIAAVPGTNTAWIVGATGAVPDPALPPIDDNLPVASGGFMLYYC